MTKLCISKRRAQPGLFRAVFSKIKQSIIDYYINGGYVPPETEQAMAISKHIVSRMNTRGIGKAIVDLALAYGRCDKDKYVLDRREVDRRLDEINRERGLLLKVRDKGGVVVVVADDNLITTYNKH